MSGCESQGGGEGPKPDAGRAKGGVGFLGRGSEPPPHQLEGLGAL